MTPDAARLLLTETPTLRGECDRCHAGPVDCYREPVHLWDDEGEWQYCRRCVEHYASRRAPARAPGARPIGLGL